MKKWLAVILFLSFLSLFTVSFVSAAESHIELIPADARTGEGTSVNYVSILYMSDGSSSDVTSQTTFSSSNTTVATISGNVATSHNAGFTEIRGIYVGAQIHDGLALLHVDKESGISNPPVITSNPITSVNENTTYSYQVTATDADGDALGYSLTQAPSWLSVSNTGLVSGTAPLVDVDTNFDVIIVVTDGVNSRTQRYVLTIKNIQESSGIVINSIPIAQINENDVYEYRVTATGGFGAYTFSLSVAPDFLSINPDTGLVYGTAIEVGAHSVVIKVFDEAGNFATQSYSLTIYGAGEELPGEGEEETPEETGEEETNVIETVVNIVADTIVAIVDAVAGLFDGGEEISLIHPSTGEEISGNAKEINGILNINHFDDLENRISYKSYRITNEEDGETYFLTINDSNNSLDIYDGSEISVKGIKAGLDDYVSDFTNVDSELITGPSFVESEEQVSQIQDESTPFFGSSDSPSAQASSSSMEKKVAVFIVHTRDRPNPFTKNDLTRMMFTDRASVKEYYLENSYNKLVISGDVLGPYYINKNSPGCVGIPTDVPFFEAKSSEIADAADGEARENGIDLDNYDYKIYFIDRPGCYRGFAFPPANRAWIYTVRDARETTIHELGHLLKLGHANAAFCGIYQTGDCENLEYGDPMSRMGTTNGKHFNSLHKRILGWLGIENGKIALQDVVYNIYPLEAPSANLQMLIAYNPVKKKGYYIDYRQPLGFDAGIPPESYTGVSIMKNQIASLRSGFFPTLLFDSTPSSIIPPSIWEGFKNAPLLDGASFYDIENKITITQLSHNEEYATVKVDYGNIGCVRKNPSAEVIGRGYGNYQLIIVNNDPPTCGDSRKFFIKYSSIILPGFDIPSGSGNTAEIDGITSDSLKVEISDDTGWKKEIENPNMKDVFFTANSSSNYKKEYWPGCGVGPTFVCTDHPSVTSQYFIDNPGCSPNPNCAGAFNWCDRDICPKPATEESRLTITTGDSVTFNWKKIGNPIGCWAYRDDSNFIYYDDWIGPKNPEGGSELIGPFKSLTQDYYPHIYVMRCNYVNAVLTNTLAIEVKRPEIPPSVALGIDDQNSEEGIPIPDGIQINRGERSTISWSVTNGDSCEASGDWSGIKDSIRGEEEIGPLLREKTYRYTLTCSNPYGSTSDTFSVRVGPPDSTPPSISINKILLEGSDRLGIECQDESSGCDENSYKYLLLDNENSDCSSIDLNEYSAYTTPVTIDFEKWICAYAEDNDGNEAFSGPKKIIFDLALPTVNIEYELRSFFGIKWVTATIICSDESGACNEDSYHYKTLGTAATQGEFEQKRAQCDDISGYINSASFIKLGWGHVACAYAEDNAGNRGFATAHFVQEIEEEPAPVCGNGDVEAGEQCDDGNTNSGDGCSASCTIEEISEAPANGGGDTGGDRSGGNGNGGGDGDTLF